MVLQTGTLAGKILYTRNRTSTRPQYLGLLAWISRTFNNDNWGATPLFNVMRVGTYRLSSPHARLAERQTGGGMQGGRTAEGNTGFFEQGALCDARYPATCRKRKEAF